MSELGFSSGISSARVSCAPTTIEIDVRVQDAAGDISISLRDEESKILGIKKDVHYTYAALLDPADSTRAIGVIMRASANDAADVESSKKKKKRSKGAKFEHGPRTLKQKIRNAAKGVGVDGMGWRASIHPLSAVGEETPRAVWFKPLQGRHVITRIFSVGDEWILPFGTPGSSCKYSTISYGDFEIELDGFEHTYIDIVRSQKEYDAVKEQLWPSPVSRRPAVECDRHAKGYAMEKRAFVLLSGGIDSTTCLHLAMKEFGGVEAISVDYGQRHRKEFEFAKRTTDALGVKHTVLTMRGILEGEGVMLTDAAVPIPNISYDEIEGVSPTYVPNRNMVLLSLITAFAQKWVRKQIDLLVNSSRNAAATMKPEPVALAEMRDSVGIYFGAHAEDAHNFAYPDCTPEFIGSMANAINVASYYTIKLHTPLEWLDKEVIIKLGDSLGVDWKNTWSCYAGGELHCGTCPTCRARRAGFSKAGVVDPTHYVR